MPRKTRIQDSSPSSESDNGEDVTLDQPPTEIEPYAILSIERTATADQIRSAYRKAALRHHPDKASPEQKEEAHKKFQEIAFAYAILSDEKRRRTYDTTGNTTESLEDDDFNWADFFQSQSEEFTAEAIDRFKAEYQGSEEEKNDLLAFYKENDGDMDNIYESVMCSNVLDDDERFRKIIDDAIKDGKLEAFSTYTKESKASKKKRVQKAKAEEAEAMETAEELGVKDKLFGTGTKPTNGKGRKREKDEGEDTLKALILQRQKDRQESFFDRLEAKYGGNEKAKRKLEEPPEEMFQKKARKARGKTK